MRHFLLLLIGIAALATHEAGAQRTQKPPLHGQEWMAITGKPLAATAGAMTFIKGATPWTPRAR